MASIDGVFWRLATIVASTAVIPSMTLYLGSTWDKTGSFLLANAYIDLNETYININGKRWWDCQTKDRTKYRH
jgi:hypothetical protein